MISHQVPARLDAVQQVVVFFRVWIVHRVLKVFVSGGGV